MAKRKAVADLNHDNWDQEDEPESAGKFQEAPEEVVQKRVIRTGKRRLEAGASNSALTGNTPEPKKAFSGFTGFTKNNSFSFLKKADTTPLQMNSIHGNLKKSDTPLKVNSINTAGSMNEGGNSNTDVHQEYLAKVRGLNEAVLAWVKQHVENNPCCILTPVFRDYDNFLKEIQSEKEKCNSSKKTISESSESSSKITTAPILSPMVPSSNSDNKTVSPLLLLNKKGSSDEAGTLSFNKGPIFEKPPSPKAKKESPEKSIPPSFNFGSKTTSFDFKFGTSKDQPKQFSFGVPLKQSSSESTGGPPEKKSFFNFGSSSSDKPSLGNFPSSVLPGTGFFKDISKPSESTENDNGDEDEEPKPEPVNPVTEDDAVFTQRVKVFVKKEGEYSDLGVGNLFIKEAPNGWHQALVRNETSLGNIIFNILLSHQQPTKRMGKNNVMIVCQPTPQHTGPAVPVLLRVKTSEEADKLLETMDKYKKK